jgi:alpha-glucoside transport system substrate-binding protein
MATPTTPENYYELLQITPDADDVAVREAVKSQRRTWVKRQHAPTIEKQREAEDRMRRIDAAETALLDPARRATYNRLLAGESSWQTGQTPAVAVVNIDWLARAKEFMSRDDAESASYAARHATQTQAGNREAWSVSASANFALGNWKDSIFEYQEALRLQPTADDQFGLGVVFESVQRWPEAISAYQSAATMNPSEPHYRVAIAGALLRTGRPEQARPILEAVNSDYPDVEDFSQLLATAISDDFAKKMTIVNDGSLVLAGVQVAQAKDDLRRALSLNFTDPGLRARLAGQLSSMDAATRMARGTPQRLDSAGRFTAPPTDEPSPAGAPNQHHAASERPAAEQRPPSDVGVVMDGPPAGTRDADELFGPGGETGSVAVQTPTTATRRQSRPLTRAAILITALMILAAVVVVFLPNTTPEPTTPGPPSATSDWCEKAHALGDLTGKSVGVLSVAGGAPVPRYQAAYRVFTECTGADVVNETVENFTAQLLTRVQAGTAPDVALLPQPGLLSEIVNDSGTVAPLPEDVAALADEYFPKDWMTYGRVNDTQFGIPNNADFKSLVWYSPKAFKDKGYRVPTTWAELQALQNQIANSGSKPWCAGIESGDSTGWMVTDWLEEYVLRTAGPDVYDQWVKHDVTFADPRIANALKQVGGVLKNQQLVNGGFSGVESIAATGVRDPAVKVLSGDCTMWKFNSDVFFPAGTRFGLDGDIDAFYYPPITEQFGRTALGSGTFYAAFNNRPEVQAFLLFVASPEYANARAQQGSFISANRGLRVDNVSSPVLKTALAILQQDNTVFRFDASDLMPVQVGSSAEWKQLTAWINGQDDATTLSNIDAAWPS